MNVQDAINHVLSQVPALTQKRLADEASLAGLKVNRGQLSAWLRREGPLSDEREANIIRALLKLVGDVSEEDSRDYRAQLADVIRVLESHLAKRKVPRTVHGEPLSSRDPGYVERVEDRRLLSWLGVDPLWASILGGPKMGKSSLLLRAAQELKRRSTTRSPILLVQIDFAGYRAEKRKGSEIGILPWFAQQCELQVGKPFRDLLSLPENFHEWLERNIIAASEAGRCAFLLDHLEELWNPEARESGDQGVAMLRPHGDLETLFTALHDYLNETYDDSRFDRCKFLFAFDNAHEAFDEVGRGLSSMRFEMNVIRTTNFSGGSVARLLEQRGLSTTEANAKASAAIEQCGGHPFLTQAWIRVHVGGEDAQVLDDAWLTLLDCLRERWSERNWKLLLTAGSSDSVYECDSTTSSNILVQSGLIERAKVRTLTDEVRPSGLWIQAKFKETLACEDGDANR